jgi:hypothetical protein
LHNALLNIYFPSWERIDARDILVSWAAAQLAITSAKRQLKLLQEPQRPLTHGEQISKRAREADISFWGRLSQRLSTQVSVALDQDEKAVKILKSLLEKGEHE